MKYIYKKIKTCSCLSNKSYQEKQRHEIDSILNDFYIELINNNKMENWGTVFQCNHTLLHLYHEYINISTHPQYNIFMVYLFNYSHSSMYEIISHCGSKLAFFLITNKWSYFYMCTRHYYISFYEMSIQKWQLLWLACSLYYF